MPIQQQRRVLSEGQTITIAALAKRARKSSWTAAGPPVSPRAAELQKRGLKELLHEAKVAKQNNNLEGALQGYKLALAMLPGEESVLLKIDALEKALAQQQQEKHSCSDENEINGNIAVTLRHKAFALPLSPDCVGRELRESFALGNVAEDAVHTCSKGIDAKVSLSTVPQLSRTPICHCASLHRTAQRCCLSARAVLFSKSVH
jgi:hypothetical protein